MVSERLLLERLLKFGTLRLGQPSIYLLNISQGPCYHSPLTVWGDRPGSMNSKFEARLRNEAASLREPEKNGLKLMCGPSCRISGRD